MKRTIRSTSAFPVLSRTPFRDDSDLAIETITETPKSADLFRNSIQHPSPASESPSSEISSAGNLVCCIAKFVLMMNPTALSNMSLNKQLCTDAVTSTLQAVDVFTSVSNTTRSAQAADVSTSAPDTSRSPRVYRRNPASGSVDKKTWRPSGSRNAELKKMAELQGTATITSNTTPRYELRKTWKRIETELNELHSHTAARCRMFLGKDQKLPKDNRLTEVQSQSRHNQELCSSNHANCLHSQINGQAVIIISVSNTSRSPQIAGVSTSAPNTSRSPQIAGVSTSAPNTSRSPQIAGISTSAPNRGISPQRTRVSTSAPNTGISPQRAGVSTSAPNTGISPVLATRVYRRNPASGAVGKKTRTLVGGFRTTELKKITELHSTASVAIPLDNHNEIHKRRMALINRIRNQPKVVAVTPSENFSVPFTYTPFLYWISKVRWHGELEKRRLIWAWQNGCVRKNLPRRLCG
ncbi:hypothetical protein BsWGS_04785 [Bradybaena similaris]